MKVCLSTAAAVLALAGAAHAQTAPATPPTSDLTRDLNSGPPVPAAYIAPPPAPVVTPAPRTAAPATAAPSTAAPARPAPAAAAPVFRPAPTTTSGAVPPGPAPAPVVTTPPRATANPATPAPTPRAAPATPSTAPPAPRTQPLATGPVAGASLPAAAPSVAPASPPPPPPSVSTVTVLNADARAALPFTVTLPSGFEIVTGRPGPDFRIYTIRRGVQSFVMVYAGPASQFPIYSGQMIEAGGRASVVSTEDGVRHAQEHLFQRPEAPREIHVWTMSLDGADRAMAEQIAQSVDLRSGP
jgi:hypothetical protein